MLRESGAHDSMLSKFDMSLSLTPNPTGALSARFEYNAGLFAAETIAFLGDCFKKLLAEVTRKPAAQLSEISLPGAHVRERQARTVRPAPKVPPVVFGSIERSIPDRFAEQVQEHGERIAVRTPDAAFTYRELDVLARRVAGA